MSQFKRRNKKFSLSQACECFVGFADGVNQRVDLFLPVHARGRNCFRADASNPDFAAHSREGKQTFSFVRIIRNQFDNLIVSSDTKIQYCTLCAWARSCIVHFSSGGGSHRGIEGQARLRPPTRPPPLRLRSRKESGNLSPNVQSAFTAR